MACRCILSFSCWHRDVCLCRSARFVSTVHMVHIRVRSFGASAFSPVKVHPFSHVSELPLPPFDSIFFCFCFTSSTAKVMQCATYAYDVRAFQKCIAVAILLSSSGSPSGFCFMSFFLCCTDFCVGTEQAKATQSSCGLPFVFGPLLRSFIFIWCNVICLRVTSALLSQQKFDAYIFIQSKRLHSPQLNVRQGLWRYIFLEFGSRNWK